MSQDTNNSPEMTEKIEIFSTEDEKIKSFGELLTNDSSRTILQLLFKQEMTANQISQKTGISLQLVKYHINKMHDMGIVKVSKVEKNTKEHDMKFYTATKFAIVILPKTVTEKAKESKSLLRSFKTLYKFAGVGVATVSAFFATSTFQNIRIEDQTRSNTGSISLDRTVTSVPQEPTEESGADLDVSAPESEFTAREPAPEPEPAPAPSPVDEFQSGEEQVESGPTSGGYMGDSADESRTLEESLELARRKIEAAQANPADGGALGIFPEYFWPVIVSIAVLGIGLALIFFLKSRNSKKSQQKIIDELNEFAAKHSK